MYKRKRKGKFIPKTRPRCRMTDTQYRALQQNGTIDLFSPSFDRAIAIGDDVEFLVGDSEAIINAHIDDYLRGKVFKKAIVSLRES